eukprot:s1858_g13.t1
MAYVSPDRLPLRDLMPVVDVTVEPVSVEVPVPDACTVGQIEAKLQAQHLSRDTDAKSRLLPFWQKKTESISSSSRPAMKVQSHALSPCQDNVALSPCQEPDHQAAEIFFATHDTWGILDTGATKTVMGSQFVSSFLQALNPEIRKQVQRSSCDVVFRYGNQGTLNSTHAMVIPVCGLRLKIAVVPGATPFLISNTLLRALGAVVDTNQQKLLIHKHHAEIPLKLTEKGLYLIDTNLLFNIPMKPPREMQIAETYAQDSPITVKNDSSVQTAMTAGEDPIKSNGMNKSSKLSDTHHHTEVCPSHNTCNTHSEPVHDTPDMPSTSQMNNQSMHVHSQVLTQGPSDHSRSCADHVHLQLDSAPATGSSRPRETSRGIDRPPDPGRPQVRDHYVWQGQHRPDVRAGVAGQSRLDKVVPAPLQWQFKVGSSEGHSIHPPEDRGERDSAWVAESEPCDAQGQGKEHATIPGSQGKSSSSIEPSHSSRDCPRDGEYPRDRSMDQPGAHPNAERDHSEHARSNGPARECHAPGDRPVDTAATTTSERTSSDGVGRCRGMGGSMSDWALYAGEIDEFCDSIPNKERSQFWLLVELIERELKNSLSHHSPHGNPIDLIEVFCSEHSTLTEQVLKQGGTALRFGYCQGDLQTTEGRKILFAQIAKHRPRHIWLSPRCGPWSCWSRFNSQRSLDTWDKIHADRLQMLSQVALCLVLCRHQNRSQAHVHWEQPKGSLMLKLPHVQEIHRYTLSAKPDMCVAGDLRDPVTMKLMRKGLEINTSSRSLFQNIDPLRCTRDHEHQVIEGTTQSQGQTVARSAFSELYPRKFARLIAKQILKKVFPAEKPVGSMIDPALLLMDQLEKSAEALAGTEPVAKKARLTPKRGQKVPVATRSSAEAVSSKRLKFGSARIQSGSEPLDDAKTCEPQITQDPNILQVMTEIENVLPRVGKKSFNQPRIMQLLSQAFPNKEIKGVLACKGTDRKYGPPKELHPQEAPYRRTIMKHRSTQQVLVDPDWEKYDELSNRQLIRKSLPCRISITVFATNPPTPSAVPQNAPPLPSLPDVAPMPVENATVPPTDPPVGSTETSSHNSPPLPETQSIEKSDSQNQSHSHEPSQSTLEGDERHGPRFRALPREEQAMLRRAHQNLCHPSADQLSAVLRSQGCRPELTQAVYDMRCSTCAACQHPKIARPSTLKHALDFNDKIFVDGITWTNGKGRDFHFYHVLDQATNYHVAVPAPSRAAEQAIQRLSEAWFQWAGPPNMIITDAATEFESETFEAFLQRHDVKGNTTAPHAHWQNGRCERHGQILQHMLNKLDKTNPIDTFTDLQQALIQCTHAKNTLSIRRGYSPEILVFGKSSRLPGSIVSSSSEAALESADRDDAHGIHFRKTLDLRERARVAFHEADNNMALRRAILRRTRPDRQAYMPGEWVMMWQPQSVGQGYWFGPVKVVNQEGTQSIWGTMNGKLHRRAPEHVRPVCSEEARKIPEEEMIPIADPSTSQHEPIITIPPDNPHSSLNSPDNHPSNQSTDNSSQSQDQPDCEPENAIPESLQGAPNEDNSHIDVPVPEGDDDLVTTHLLCMEDEVMTVDPKDSPCAWRFEVELPTQWNSENTTNMSADQILLATTEKKQRTEVKLSMLTPNEVKAFEKAKESEVHNWLSTGTVSKILREKLSPEQILRCRWILTWKPLEEINAEQPSHSKLHDHKAKARLVVLGYLDPNLTEVPRDSPTLGRQSKMLLLQLIASCGWSLGSFDIRAAFLQGKPQQDRVIGLEPVKELASAMKLKDTEVCKLDKSAYGLIDAPYLWYQTLHSELMQLGFTPCPFDPCLYLLRNPKTQKLAGAASWFSETRWLGVQKGARAVPHWPHAIFLGCVGASATEGCEQLTERNIVLPATSTAWCAKRTVNFRSSVRRVENDLAGWSMGSYNLGPMPC